MDNLDNIELTKEDKEIAILKEALNNIVAICNEALNAI